MPLSFHLILYFPPCFKHEILFVFKKKKTWAIKTRAPPSTDLSPQPPSLQPAYLLCSSPAQVVPALQMCPALLRTSLRFSDTIREVFPNSIHIWMQRLPLLFPVVGSLFLSSLSTEFTIISASASPNSFSTFSGLISLLLTQTLLPVLSEVRIDHQLGSC